MEYGEKFKKSIFGGFNRQDVLKCFEEVNARYQQETGELIKERDALKTTSDTLQKEREDLKGQLEAIRQEKEALEQTVAQLNEKTEELTTHHAELQRELANQKALNSKLNMERDVLESNNRQLTVKVQELEAKQEKEKTGLEIGEIMLEAKNAADKIVARAHERSARLRDLTRQETSQAEKQLDQTRDRLTAAMDSFKSFSNEAVRRMEQLQKDLKEARTRINTAEEKKKEETAEAPAEEPKKCFKSDFLFRK